MRAGAAVAEHAPAPSGTLDPLQLFMDSAGRHKLLTAAEEVALAKRIERGDDAAKERMITRFSPRRLDREALPGPRRAAAGPDPGGRDRPQPRRREVRLAEGLQVLDLRDLVDPPGLPARGRQPVEDDPDPRARPGAADQAEPRLRRASGEAGPRGDGRGARGGDPPQARAVEEALDAVDSISLNQGLGSDGDSELGDLFADETSLDPAEEAVDSLRRQRVQRAVAELPERQRRIIELRFGFGGEAASLETIEKELGLTRERVRQLESEALMRLQLELGDELASAA